MKIKDIASSKLVFLDANFSSKEELLNFACDKLLAEEIITSKEDFLNSVLDREKQSPTGFEKGIAIPHGKSAAVKKAAIVALRLENELSDWESIDPTNKVKLVFLLAIPEGEANNTHLSILSTLSANLIDDNYIKNLYSVKTVNAFMNSLDVVQSETKKQSGDYILAVTACATGIAHTYMAAKALEQAGEEMGIQVIVEKQAATGIEDAHTSDLIKGAKGVIFATDVAVKNQSRYEGMNYVKTRVATPLKESKELIEKVLHSPDGKVVATKGEEEDAASEDKGITRIAKAVMTGISYMIPIIVAGGLMMGIARLCAAPWGLSDSINDIAAIEALNSSNEAFLMFLHWLEAFGSLTMKFMYPVFAAYTAYALAGRVGIAPGLMGGILAAGLHYTIWGIPDMIPSGFMGALILGVLAGLLADFLNKKIKVSANFQAIKPMFLIPGITVFVVFVMNYIMVDPFFNWLNSVIYEAILGMDTSQVMLFSAVIAAATAFDLGGPINKAAGAVSMGLAADGVFPITARVLSIVIPPIGVGLSTMFDKWFKTEIYDENFRVLGSTSFMLGFLGISEGAIPFMIKNPIITISINITGAIIGSCIAVYLGAVQWLPLPAIWGWPLVENLWAYLFGLAIGALFIAFANIVVRKYVMKKQGVK